jgi:hypothetical protein
VILSNFNRTRMKRSRTEALIVKIQCRYSALRSPPESNEFDSDKQAIFPPEFRNRVIFHRENLGLFWIFKCLMLLMLKLKLKIIKKPGKRPEFTRKNYPRNSGNKNFPNFTGICTIQAEFGPIFSI